jgi:hypothetical protein
LPPINKVSFDYRTELISRKDAARERRKFLIDPQLPTITKQVEIHCPKVHLTFTLQFLALCGYATLLDVVAREVLRDRAAFNAYLQEFDSYIAQAADAINGRLAEYEVAAKQQMTANRRPYTCSVDIAGRRGLQLLTLYEGTDRLLRHAQYLEFMDKIENRQLVTLEQKSIKTLRTAFSRMRRVILSVKQKIKADREEYGRRLAAQSAESALVDAPDRNRDDIEIVLAKPQDAGPVVPVVVSEDADVGDLSRHLEEIDRLLAMGGGETDLAEHSAEEDAPADEDRPRTVVRTRRVAAE